jgi:hypothetical protein
MHWLDEAATRSNFPALICSDFRYELTFTLTPSIPVGVILHYS